MFNRLILNQFWCLDILEQEVSVEEVEELLQAPCSMNSCWNAEDLIQFFESLALGLWNEEQNAEESNDIPARIPAESTGRGESLKK